MSKIREPFNTWSHFVGAVAVLLGVIGLCVAFWSQPLAVVGFIVFGLGTAFLYSSSAAYHWTPRPILALQKMDHSAIFAMIAASYTPLCLLALPSPVKWAVLGLQWGLALVGILVTTLTQKPPTWFRLVLYVSMGWMALPLAPMVLEAAPVQALIWMVLGGLAYTIGIIFYVNKKPILWPGKFSNHEVWHLFVMAGTCCHFVMMWWIASR